MIFYVLDAAWDKSKNKTLGQFLSGANPFLFADSKSADPAVFQKISEKTPQTINIEDSYAVALEYITSLNNREVQVAFETVNRQEWIDGVNKYLSNTRKN